MIGRSLRGSPGASVISSVWNFCQPRPGRIRAAFLVGLGLAALGVFSIEAGIAAGLINGGASPLSFVIGQAKEHRWRLGLGGARAPGSDATVAWRELDPDARRRRDRAEGGAARALASLPRRSVCVRLCDGYFFPIGPIAGEGELRDHEAACSGLCPDAQTELFIEPAGSDRIEDAVARNGARYSSLSTALANRASTEKSCACHRRPGESFPLAQDFTLRGGDSVMTPSGFLVFRGTGHAPPYSRGDFTPLAGASMSRDKRAVLAALERASTPGWRPTVAALAQPRRSEIAFAAPAAIPFDQRADNRAIRFAEPTTAAKN